MAELGEFSARMVRVQKNYRPLAQSSVVSADVTVGKLLDAHAALREAGTSAAKGGELAGPWFVYKEGSDEATTITTQQVDILVKAGAVVREVTLRELILVGQDFSGPTLAKGGELVGPWYVLKEGSNNLETLGDVDLVARDG